VTATGEAARPTADPDHGLSSAAVAERLTGGWVNVVTDDQRRTVKDIVRANVLTRFNAILAVLVAVVLLTGQYRDALFGIVAVANSAIGIVQEVRAKRTLDRLALVSAPRVRAVRDGRPVEIPTDQVVLDDVIDLQPGDQVPVDGVVLTSAGLEVDESLLTGESDPLAKGHGDRVLSGSFVVAGQGRFAATHVGDHAYAARLAREAKEFTSVDSELRNGTDVILTVGVWVMVPATVLLIVSQLRSAPSISDALRTSVAGIGAIVPEGLVLLTSLAFAVGATRLAQRRALVQELPAVEVLARVDVICVDKTGTLTAGALCVTGIERPGGEPADDEVLAALGALVAAEDRPNPSLQAIAAVGRDPGWELARAVPFSSARKWSAATFVDRGSWLLGAPDVLLGTDDPLRSRVEELASTGTRVLLVARTDGDLDDPGGFRPSPVALVCLDEDIRPDAAATIRYFREQGVAVKVISGDNPLTVGAIATEVGVPGADAPVDARRLPEDPESLAAVMEGASVFGRVQPHQKRAMVRALQHHGHTVAMTGDGVNDVLALKDADMGVAMGSGSGASRSVAQLVLLDDSFSSLPVAVAEGRRVIANVERVANLFVTKSVYAAVLAFAVGLTTQPFPFFPRHLTIISSLTIGIPAFFLALAPNDKRAEPGFVERVARFSIPAGVVAAAATFAGFNLVEDAGVTPVEARTSALVVLFLVAMWVLVLLARPLNEWKAALLGSMAVAFVIALGSDAGREFFELRLPPLLETMAVIGVAAVAIGVIELGWNVGDWWSRRFPSPGGARSEPPPDDP
jgi:cation-transporting ATPase E